MQIIGSSIRSAALLFTVLLTTLASTAGATEPINKTLFGSYAIKGYDAVAYFEQSKAVKGDKDFSHSWMDATWLFASAQHRDLFAADPAKYAPQYGGYCAWAVSQGDTANIDPQSWKIVDGKLYLNYSSKIQRRWEGDIEKHIRDADENWPKILADD